MTLVREMGQAKIYESKYSPMCSSCPLKVAKYSLLVTAIFSDELFQLWLKRYWRTEAKKVNLLIKYQKKKKKMQYLKLG